LLVGILVPKGSRFAATEGVTPEASPSACPTTPDQNKDLVDRYWDEVYNNRLPERADTSLTDDSVRHNPGRP